MLLSEDYGLPSDIFSLGMIFVEMLTGKEPSPTFPERPPQVLTDCTAVKPCLKCDVLLEYDAARGGTGNVETGLRRPA